jgi:hypothetical protein
MHRLLALVSMTGLMTMVAVSEAAAEPVPIVSTATFHYDARPLATWSTHRFVITNRGSAPATLQQRNLKNYLDYSIDPAHDTCFTTEPLAPGESCRFDVVFHPATQGVRDGSVTWVFESGPVTVTLVGVGSDALGAGQFGSITAGGRQVAAVVSTGLQRAAVRVPNVAL